MVSPAGQRQEKGTIPLRYAALRRIRRQYAKRRRKSETSKSPDTAPTSGSHTPCWGDPTQYDNK